MTGGASLDHQDCLTMCALYHLFEGGDFINWIVEGSARGNCLLGANRLQS